MIFLSKLCCFTTLLIYHVVEKWKEPLNISISLGDSEFSETFACNITVPRSLRNAQFPTDAALLSLGNRQNKRCRGQWGRLMLLKSYAWIFRNFCDSCVVDLRLKAFSQRMQDVRSPMHKDKWKVENRVMMVTLVRLTVILVYYDNNLSAEKIE